MVVSSLTGGPSCTHLTTVTVVGNSEQVNLIMANEITPHLTAEEYMDKGEYENELKQVIGDTKVIGRIRAYREIRR